jgi:uracil-DNA glycosylase
MAIGQGGSAIPNSSILIVSEYLSDKDESGAMTSPIGHVFRGWMKQVGVNPDHCHFVSVLRGPSLNEALTKDKTMAAKGLRSIGQGRYFRNDMLHHLEHLRNYINKLNPNVVVALGDLSMWACTSERSLKNARGRVTLGIPAINERKVIPTYSPTQVMADYPLRPIVLADLAKALRESASPSLHRPQRWLHLAPSLLDMKAFYHQYIVPAEAISVDIETKGAMITCVGFAPSKDRCLIIPFFDESQPDGNYWRTKEDERLAWVFVRKVLAEKPSFGQNFQYDMQYLWREVGIGCPKFCDDTMLLHHALQPEMQKGLGFLASIYTDEMAWKFMHKMKTDDKTGKKEDV